MIRIIFLISTLIVCSMLICFCIFLKSDPQLQQQEIINQMQERLLALEQQINTIIATEYTPFIWDSEFCYVGSYPVDRLMKSNAGTNGDDAKKVHLDDVDHIQTFFNQDTLVFDTGIMRVYPWLFSHNGKLCPKDKLDLLKGETSVRIVYFNTEQQRNEFYEKYNK